MVNLSEISDALASLQAMLAADGYELDLSADGPETVVARITAGPGACEDCLVPKPLMRAYFADSLKPVCKGGVPEIRLVYPGERA